MPGDPKDCRKHAERCRELAGSLPDKRAREIFAQLAESWLRLAVELEDAQAFLDTLTNLPETQFAESIEKGVASR